MKTEKIILALLFGASAAFAQTNQLSSSIHQFVVTDIDGNPFHFNSLKVDVNLESYLMLNADSSHIFVTKLVYMSDIIF